MEINDSRRLFAQSAPLADPPLLVADALRTPENVGALVRLSANVGQRRLLLVGGSELCQRKVRRTACMALDYVDIERVEPAALPGALPDGYRLVAIETTPDARSLYLPNEPLPDKVALVVGSEVRGISPDVLKLCQETRYIPMMGPDTSLNVAQAAAIALFEWVRQQQQGTRNREQGTGNKE